MIKTICVILATLAISSAAVWQPRDLVEEVQEQLNQLRAIVQGQINVAHTKIDSLVTAFKTNSVNVAETASTDFKQQQQTIASQLTTIKDLAHAADKDITPCTMIREVLLNQLPEEYTKEMNQCIYGVDTQAGQAAASGKYLVDIYFSKVHDLEYQVNRCNGDLLCISPILTEIELDKIRLPQNINTEVSATEKLMDNMRLLVKSCADGKVAQYVAGANAILGDIEICVNKIIGLF